MTDKKFNRAMKLLFNNFIGETEMSDAVYNFWINNELTEEQTDILDVLKIDIATGQDSCAAKYFIRDTQCKPRRII